METQDYYRYLVRLRDSGRTNMYGASPYLEGMFGLGKSEAIKVLTDWMDSLDLPEEEQPDDGR